MTHLSEPQVLIVPPPAPKPECEFCHGKLSIIVSRDPDEEVDCVCVEKPVIVEPPVWRGEHV